jgi:N-acetylmuramoyl-L-alanine amidase
VVVIDAGHGGEDPGAIGRHYRTREKDVVLKIARYVEQELKRMPGIRPRLTRNGDYFISLGRRVAKANQWSGDLFVSIHADSSRNRRTQGTHVYTLAPRSSQDRRAVRVAHMENASDLVGGVQAAARLPMIFDRNGAPNNIVESRVLSHLAMDRLEDVNKGTRKGRRSEARFWVLKGKRPSILVETGFLSNKQDEKNLRSDKFQRRLAKRIALAVKDYYDSRVTATDFVYTIKRGDNLTHIAKRYGVRVSDLMAVNKLHNASRLKAGARLVIPVRGGVAAKPSAPKPVVKKVALTRSKPSRQALLPGATTTSPTTAQRHKVRRGENPTRIARRYKVRLVDLLSANRMTTRSRLAVGQVLLIPAGRSHDRVHRVGRGETLSGLAQRYGVSLSKLARVNDLGTRSKLKRGRSLIVPDVGPAPQRATSHRVRSGETLSGLAQRFGVSLSKLAKANRLSTRARLLKGQRLTIPGDRDPRVHVIRRGDSLSRIASRYDVSVDRLLQRNNIADADHLEIGGRLLISD